MRRELGNSIARILLELGQRARNGLDREPEIIGDVLTRHRQFHDIAGKPVGHVDQEGGDALLRGLDQQHGVTARMFEFATGQRPELVGDIAVLRGGRQHRGAPHHDHMGLRDRFRRRGMVGAELDPEHVAGMIEGFDLPASVLQDLVNPHGAAQDHVDIVRRLVLAVDFGVARKRHRRAQKLGRAEKGVAGRMIGHRAGRTAGRDDDPVGGLNVHGLLLKIGSCAEYGT